mmetsp:Transcript_99418/g.196988  ORF Transcript_99418/g.196988 Transcript_99418/m.196988 type:complete len:422 (-) Transcript_99418:175-1440(-)|eukprot:CAMPEP_0172718704 /NCGR_PEP_ID=MMETSP1074-20121228/75085_1 /TAXON_ID=2916 /ORGANISM="Ceratium fusus, Strain PA161109" /LENGTH=421 /DNA_ID=CAMNT_0013543973 /DNA_START=86 /DNA_END=1351 /DNA_ORIENTATION=+
MSTDQQASRQNTVEFDRGLLGRWLHMILVAFYNDEEAVVADLLYQRAALLKDTHMGKALGLTEKQVRQALERRLVPDNLVERRTEGNAPSAQTFYRIHPAAVAVAARRFQAVEDKLGRSVEDKYSCPKCRRTYDSLQAVSLTKHPKSSCDNSGAFAFMCEECGEELAMASETAKSRHDLLQRFRSQCRDLLLLTREIQSMPIPHFKREEKKKDMAATLSQSRAATAAATATAAAAAATMTATAGDEGAGGEAGEGGAGVLLSNEYSNTLATVGSDTQKAAASSDAWFHREILGTDPVALGPGPDAEAEQKQKIVSDAELRMAVEQAQDRLREERAIQHSRGLAERVKTVQMRASNGQRNLERNLEDPTVTVRGQPYPLSKVRDDHTMHDAMTDEEYQKFVDIDRQMQMQASSRRAGENDLL